MCKPVDDLRGIFFFKGHSFPNIQLEDKPTPDLLEACSPWFAHILSVALWKSQLNPEPLLLVSPKF